MRKEISKAIDSRNCTVVRPEWQAKSDARKVWPAGQNPRKSEGGERLLVLG